MNYLTDKVASYQCPSCLVAGEADVWINDDYVGLCCGECGEEVKSSGERDAVWWSVGVYSVSRSYGGPEEGGWWYDTGSRIDEWHVRGFEDQVAARAYFRELQKQYAEENDVLVLGFTETLPVRSFPEHRPFYY